MPIRSVTLRILGESRSARAEMDWVNREADKIDKRKTTLHIGADTPVAKLTDLRLKLEALTHGAYNLKINADDKPSQLAFARLQQTLLKLHSTADKLDVTPKLSLNKMAAYNAELAAADVAYTKLGRSVENFGKDTQVVSTRLLGLFTPGGGFGRFGAFFGGKFNLFGGLLGGIGTLHLLADVLGEVLAVWIPATVAAVAFGVAASDAAVQVFRHMSNLHTVMDATGKSIYPMTNAMERLHNAVRPAVYQVFGDALTIMNAKTGLFQRLAMGASHVVTQLAARLTVALKSGNGFGQFMRNAIPDLSKLGNAFGSLFGIIGNLIHAMPGYAEILLNFGGGVLRLAEYVTKVGEPLVHLGLVAHGFIVWAGLGATLAFGLGRALVFLGKTAIGTAIKSFGVFVADLITVALTEGIATAATFAFSAALDVISANPLIWIGAAVGAIAGLVFWMSRSETATQKWGDSLQKTIDDSSSLTQMIQRTQGALVITSNRLGTESNKLAHTQEFMNAVNIRTGQSTKILTGAYQQQKGVVAGVTEQQKRFSSEVQFNAGRMGGLAKAYHGAGNAMALLNAAGVTQKEWQDRSAEGWAIIIQMINGTIMGYKAMGQSGSMLNNDLNVMDRNITDQYTAMQKLNQAWDIFITDVTGNQNNFDTFALGIQTLGKNFDTASKVTARTTHTFGGLRESAKLAGATMDGLSQASLTVNQAFATSIQNANTLFDSLRTAGIGGNQFKKAVQDTIAPLVKYARGSGEATAQLIALAQEAGYHLPENMKSLVKWLGNTHNATAGLKSITDQATQTEALLTGSMRAQGNFIANKLIGDINNAILSYNNVEKAATAYGNAVAKSGRQSDAAHAARRTLITDIIASGRAAGDSKNQIAAMITKVLGIPTKRALEIVMKGTGSYSVKNAFGGSGAGPIPHGLFNHAEGGIIRGPGTGTSDSIPALISNGEYIVKAASVNMYGKGTLDAVNAGRAAIVPQFADGGLVQTGSRAVNSGQAAVNMYDSFANTMGTTLVNALAHAIKQAMFGGGGAIAAYAKTFATGNNHPYVWGGTTPAGWDCSGFTSFIYRHFGYNPPRTSEAQYAWGQKSPDQPGAMVFFNSPAGGPPPGHVGISMGDGRMANAAGTGIGTIMSGSGGNMGFRIPPGGFRGGGGGGAFGGTVRENQLSQLWIAAGGPANVAHVAAAIAMAESGGRANAHNPSGASGLWQILGQVVPGNIFNPFVNAENAVMKWRDARGFGPWVTYVDGAYKRFLADGTDGALPGWAVVGERGPELVHMKGGETVLDNNKTMKALRGYARGVGREERRGITLIHEFTHDTSRNKLWADMRSFLKIIADYSSGAKEKERKDLVRKQVEAMVSLDRKIQHDRANVRAEKSYQAATLANLSGYGALSGLTLGPTAGVGDNVALSGGQGLKAQLKTKLATLKQFAQALKTLSKMKLPNSLFRQIVDMGPDTGLPYAQELISGGPAFIKQLAGLERDITHEEKRISQGAASSIYTGKYRTGDKYWDNIAHQKAELEKEFRKLGRILGEEAGRWFHVPKRRRPKGFAAGGILTEPVWGTGISGQEYTFGEAGAEFFAPMTTPRSAGRIGGGDTYNITVRGDTNPDAAALRIIQAVRDYKRHHGNQSTGIG